MDSFTVRRDWSACDFHLANHNNYFPNNRCDIASAGWILFSAAFHQQEIV